MGIIRPVISTRQRSSMVLRGLVGSVVCLALLTSACNDSQKPQESPKPSPAGYCRRPASSATGGPAVY